MLEQYAVAISTHDARVPLVSNRDGGATNSYSSFIKSCKCRKFITIFNKFLYCKIN